MKITEKEAIAADGKYIHRIGSDAYFTRCTLLQGETAASFEEVDNVPTLLDSTKQAKINEIKEYDKSNKVNQFSIQGVSMWLDKDTRTGLRLRFEAEKNKGIETTNLWYEGQTFELPIEAAIAMLYEIELYASQCYDNTQRHISNVMRLTTEDDINSYNYRSGYPKMLSL